MNCGALAQLTSQYMVSYLTYAVTWRATLQFEGDVSFRPKFPCHFYMLDCYHKIIALEIWVYGERLNALHALTISA